MTLQFRSEAERLQYLERKHRSNAAHQMITGQSPPQSDDIIAYAPVQATPMPRIGTQVSPRRDPPRLMMDPLSVRRREALADERLETEEKENPPSESDDATTIIEFFAGQIPDHPALTGHRAGVRLRVVLTALSEEQVDIKPGSVVRAIDRMRDRWDRVDRWRELTDKASQKTKPKKQESDEEHPDALIEPNAAATTSKVAAADGAAVAIPDNEPLGDSGLTFKEWQSRSRFKATAYNGGLIIQDHMPAPVVIDLASVKPVLTQSGHLTILKDHSSEKPIGHARVEVLADSIQLSDGRFSVSNAHSFEVVGAIANGQEWQCSVRGKFGKVKLLKAKETAVVNGRTFEGPKFIAENFRCRECSFVGLGANQPGESDSGAFFTVEVT